MAGAEKKLSHPTEAAIAIKAAIDIDERVRDEVAVSGLRASYFAEVSQHFDFYIDLLMSESRPDGSNEIKGLEISERKRARSLLDEVAFSSRVTSAANGDVAALVERERKLKTQIEAKRDEYATLRQDKLSTSHAEQTAAELLRLNQEYDQLHSVTLSQDISRSPKIPPRPLTAKEIQNVVDDDSTLLLEFSLGEERTFLWAISRGAIESYELPKRSIIEQQVLELNRAIRTMIRRQTPIGDKEAGPSVVRSDEDFQKHAQALSKILLAPAARHITSAKRIVIIPDGALHYVPFAALPQLDWSAYGPATASNLHGPSTSRPLLADYEITLIPSVSFLVAFRDRVEGVPGPSKNIAIIANPVFEKNDERLLSKQSGSLARIGLSQQGPASSGAATEEPDMKKMLRETDRRRTEKAISQLLRDTESESGTLPRLFSTQREALEIQSLAGLGNSLVAINFDANRKILTSGTLKDYRFIHFATHGFFDSLHPELSGIVLSLFDEQGRPQNGFIQISDLYNLNLSAELVVLSACQTGLGKQVKGEGVMGLTRAFMAAGAHRVVASLWKVDDDATSELMARFYRHLLKEKATPSAALRAAQLEISVKPKWRQPFYWAGFFITGDFH
jgi:CHAT domain-containing protein